MNSAHAFSFASGGSYTEAQMQQNAAYVNQAASKFSAAGGWMAEQANKLLTGFNEFMDSRAWEMSKRIFNLNTGEFVGRYDLGYLGSLTGLQNAQGFMRNQIMAHPVLQQAYIDGDISGYGGEFHHLCFGIAEDNIFWRRQKNGLLQITQVDEKPQLKHTHYYESLGAGYSFRNRVDLEATHRAIDYQLAKDLLNVMTDAGGMKAGKEGEEQTIVSEETAGLMKF